MYGTYAAKTDVKSKRAFGSANAMSACFALNALFLMPVSFPATRLTAMRRSLSFKKRAFEGVSGNKKNITNDQRQVAPPS